MTYRIVITKTEQILKVKPKEWKPIKSTGDVVDYGHTPEVETIMTETSEVYTQTVDDLDLRKVIDAVNTPMTFTSRAVNHCEKHKLFYETGYECPMCAEG